MFMTDHCFNFKQHKQEEERNGGKGTTTTVKYSSEHNTKKTTVQSNNKKNKNNITHPVSISQNIYCLPCISRTFRCILSVMTKRETKNACLFLPEEPAHNRVLVIWKRRTRFTESDDGWLLTNKTFLHSISNNACSRSNTGQRIPRKRRVLYILSTQRNNRQRLSSNNKNKRNDSRNNRDSDNDNKNTTMIAEKKTRTTTKTISKIHFTMNVIFCSLHSSSCFSFLRKLPRMVLLVDIHFVLNLCTLYFRKSWRSLCLVSIDQICHQDV